MIWPRMNWPPQGVVVEMYRAIWKGQNHRADDVARLMIRPDGTFFSGSARRGELGVIIS